MSCYGRAFYEQYRKRLKYDPIGALSMLRAHKNRHVNQIDRELARVGFVRQEPEPMKKEERN